MRIELERLRWAPALNRFVGRGTYTRRLPSGGVVSFEGRVILTEAAVQGLRDQILQSYRNAVDATAAGPGNDHLAALRTQAVDEEAAAPSGLPDDDPAG